MPPDGDVLSFPDDSKLELDGMMDRLVELANGVKLSQGRLRGLLRANELVVANLDTEEVLEQLVRAACELAGARYGALGVISYDGGLERFIHVGMTSEVVEEIGHLPEGKGLLGALITDPRPIRVDRISDEPRSSGFPDNHPPMNSFLGVPINLHGEVFGNLYLTESDTGHFSSEDEALVRSLAITAGTAIAHARLYDESRRQQRWSAAAVEISAELLAESGHDPLAMVARRSIEIADADLVTVSLISPDQVDAVIAVADGTGAGPLSGKRFPLAGTPLERVVTEKSAVLVNSAGPGPEWAGALGRELQPGSVMVIPLPGAVRTRGVLTIARRSGRAVFTSVELDLASAFAVQAGVALEIADARLDRQRVVLLEDRDRIARDLHDHVIQQLFAIGLSLDNAANQSDTNEKLALKLRTRVGDIDRTIRQIRTSIFALTEPRAISRDGLRKRVLELAADLQPTLGFDPSVAFSGAVDTLLEGDTVGDVLACVREGLTNVGKHARATRVDVDVEIVDHDIVVFLTDNGIGMSGAVRSSGLSNLRQRAEARGGSFTVSSPPGGGSKLTWKVPLQ